MPHNAEPKKVSFWKGKLPPKIKSFYTMTVFVRTE